MANVHWFNLASMFSDKSPTTDYTAWWAQKLHFAFDSYLQQESEMGLDYMFGTTSYSKDLVQVLLRDFILCIKRHKRDEFPMSFGVKFQIWLSFLCQAFEQHSLPGSHDTHSTVQILTVKQNFFKTTLTSAQEISGIKHIPEPVNLLSSEPVFFVRSELLSFKFLTEKTVHSPVIFSKPSTALSCVKDPKHNARNFKKILQSTTENPPGCTKQQTSVFPDYEHLYQEFCTIFLWDHIHERTNIKLDNSSGAQSFLSLETIPSTQNSNLPIFDPATSIKPNIAASQRNSKSSVIFQSPIYLTRKFDKPLQPKTIIPPGFDNSSQAQTLVNFSWTIKGIQFVTKRFSAFPISHGSTKTSLQNIKQTLAMDETTSDYVHRWFLATQKIDKIVCR